MSKRRASVRSVRSNYDPAVPAEASANLIKCLARLDRAYRHLTIISSESKVGESSAAPDVDEEESKKDSMKREAELEAQLNAKVAAAPDDITETVSADGKLHDEPPILGALMANDGEALKRKSKQVVKAVFYRMPGFKNVFPSMERLQFFLADYYENSMQFLKMWPKQKHPVLDEEDFDIDPAPLVYFYQMTMSILYQYRQQYTLINTLFLKEIFPKILYYLQFSSHRKATSPHWTYLPSLALMAPTKYQASEVLGVSRHEVDPRFDRRKLHKKDATFEEAGRLMRKFVGAPLDTVRPNKLDVNGKLIDCTLTATYPWVKKVKTADQKKKKAQGRLSETSQMMELPLPADNEITKRYNPRPTQDHFLYNDPNADGFLLTLGHGIMIGAVADGSGAGHQARLASNLCLAAMYDMLIDSGVGRFESTDPPPQDQSGAVEDQQQKKEEPELAFKADLSQFKTTHDVLKFLEKVILHGHTKMAATDECGATTVVMYVLMKMDPSAIPEDIRHSGTAYVPFSTGTNKNDYVMTYMIAGDIEAFWYDNKHSKRWTSLHSAPLLEDGIRMNASFTPGGIGKKHGDKHRVWGTYLWRDEYLNQCDPQLVRAYYQHGNNLHFGQVICDQHDYFIFSSDGLGDTLDPIQLFPHPNLIKGFEQYLSWRDYRYAAGGDQALVMRDLKEMTLNKVLGKTMQAEKRTAKNILESCVAHAIEATDGDRTLYVDEEYSESSERDQQVMMDRSVQMWIKRNWYSEDDEADAEAEAAEKLSKHQPDVPKRGPQVHFENYYAIRGKHVKKTYSLPDKPFVPFAKVDHVGIQVVAVDACVRTIKDVIKE